MVQSNRAYGICGLNIQNHYPPYSSKGTTGKRSAALCELASAACDHFALAF